MLQCLLGDNNIEHLTDLFINYGNDCSFDAHSKCHADVEKLVKEKRVEN
jgi:hypothetical protein